MTALSRKNYLAVARAIRDSGAAFESKTKIVGALVDTFTHDDETVFNRHLEAFTAIALSPERAR